MRELLLRRVSLVLLRLRRDRDDREFGPSASLQDDKV